jgi:hypothetical protein
MHGISGCSLTPKAIKLHGIVHFNLGYPLTERIEALAMLTMLVERTFLPGPKS